MEGLTSVAIGTIALESSMMPGPLFISLNFLKVSLDAIVDAADEGELN